MNHNVLIDEVEAISMNASAMAAMIAVGDPATEASTIANISRLVDIGQKYGIPVMGVTAVGKDMARDARYFGLASRVCAENGASIVKTYHTEGFENVVACTPVPVVIAGGKKLPELEALELAYNAIQCGAAGVDMGRNVFQSDAPLAMIKAIGGVVHDNLKPQEAFEKISPSGPSRPLLDLGQETLSENSYEAELSAAGRLINECLQLYTKMFMATFPMVNSGRRATQ